MDIEGASEAVYLDYNATSPPSERVTETILHYLKNEWYNPSSGYPEGAAAKEAIQKARQQVAEALNCGSEEVFFTSGATESINWSLKGVVQAYANTGRTPHIVTTAVEHPATLKSCEWLKEYVNAQVTYVKVNHEGIVKAQDVVNAITSNTCFVSVMLANVSATEKERRDGKFNEIYFDDVCRTKSDHSNQSKKLQRK